MISRRIYRHRRGRRWLAAVGTLSIVVGLFAFTGSSFALTQSAFELDRNATDDLTTELLGTLKSQLNAGTAGSSTTTVVCERQTDHDLDPATPPLVIAQPTTPFTIQIDAERLTVTARSTGTVSTGGCGFKNPADSTAAARTWTITRGTSAPKHAGGSEVTHIVQDTSTSDVPPGDDWDQVYTSVKADKEATPPVLIHDCDELGAVACSWEHDDFNKTVYTTGGSKDDLNINPLAGEAGTGWKWTDSSVPPADEILDAFAIKYSISGRQLLFFGADRWATNGAKDFGFWFFRSEVSLNADGTFSGNHTRPGPGPDQTPGTSDDTRGDILALGTFTNGGAITTLRLFEWVGVGGDTNGTLDDLGTLGDCAAGGGSTEGCNTVNNTTVPSPWPYQGAATGAAANQFYSGAFMEGGIDLTALGLEGCFASFVAETRSSPEPGAQLKDFVLGTFESCGATVVTTPKQPSLSTPPGPPISLNDDTDSDGLKEISVGTGDTGATVVDSAVLNVTGTSTFDGEIDFFICGPIAHPTTCATGGVPAGTRNADTNGTYVSDEVNLTEVGRYCWRADFSSTTAGLTDGASDSSLGECFEVMPVRPTLSTQAVGPGPLSAPVSGPVNFGDPVFDQAILLGTAHQKGTNGGSDPGQAGNTYPSINATDRAPANGTITFELRGPDGEALDCTTVAAITSGDNPETVDVEGDGNYFTSGVVPASPGDYHWVAVYSGDDPNTLGTDHNTDCTDDDEDVSVQKLQPLMSTAQNFVPNDSATITVAAGAGDLAGRVRFFLFVDDATCGGGDLGEADYSTPEPGIDVTTGTGSGLSRTVTSDNETAYSTSGTTFHWVVTYDSSNSAHFDVTSGCGNEHSSITINNGVSQPAPGP